MTIDLTGISLSILSGVFSLLGIFITTEINARARDKQAAATLNSAIQNALGAIQQATVSQLKDLHPKVQLEGIPDDLAVGVQYVLDHAGDEAARFGLTPALLAEKISAQIGLRTLSIHQAQAALGVPPPALAPVLSQPTGGKL